LFSDTVVSSHIDLHRSNDALTEAQEALIALDSRAEAAVQDALPPNTRRAYGLELTCFASWCVRHALDPNSAPPRAIRAYLFELAETGRDPKDVPSGKPKGPMGYSSLIRALAAICRSYRRLGKVSPWLDPVLVETRDALGRLKGTAAKRKKRDIGVTGEGLLYKVIDLISDDVRGVRDRAMILVGWQGGGRRRSEIAAARVEDFRSVEQGIEWTIPRSKTDQTGKSLTVPLSPVADQRYCPVASFRRWLSVAKIDRGPVFRGVDMHTGAVLTQALAPVGVARRVQRYVSLLGLDPAEFGGHSLRSGFVTSAAKMGRQPHMIMAETGHRSIKQMNEYIRRAGLFEESAGRGLIDEALAKRTESKP